MKNGSKLRVQRQIALLSCFLLLIGYSTDAQPRQAIYPQKGPIPLTRWEVVDIVFNVKHKVADEFRVEFGAVFENGQGQEQKVKGFFNGGSQWILRYSANAFGTWKYKTYSTLPSLSGLEGVLVCVGTSGHQHGSVRVSQQSIQHFAYEDSTSYLSLAFELDWLFALDFHNKSDIPRTRQIIDGIKRNGFNQVVMNVYAYDVKWKTSDNVPERYQFARPSFSPFAGTASNPDFKKLNIQFFQHLDRVIEHLHDENIVAHLMIYVWNKLVKWPEMYSDEDNRYFDYVIARYQAFPNMIWDVSKEALDYGRCDIPYINERISRIRTNDSFKRLVTVHDYEYCSREPDKVDFVSIQSWRSDLYSTMLRARQIHLNKPVVNIEHGGYEVGPYFSFKGNYTDPATCLERAYECLFAGVYPTYYWQDAAWNIVVYDALDSLSAGEQPNFKYYKNLMALFSKFDFNKLFPVVPKITTNSRLGLDNLSTSAYQLTDGKSLYMFFLPRDVEYLNTILPRNSNAKCQITWYNPISGEWIEGGVSDWTSWGEYKSPWVGQNSILIINNL